MHDVKPLRRDPEAAGFAAVIAGHSYRPAIEQRGSVLYLNPGSAAASRY